VEEPGQAAAAAPTASADDETRARQRERASTLPPLQPIQKPVPQE